MSVRRGPTEQDRSEGTPTKEGPNREQALLVTFSWSGSRLFKSNSPKAKQSAVRQTLSAAPRTSPLFKRALQEPWRSATPRHKQFLDLDQQYRKGMQEKYLAP